MPEYDVFKLPDELTEALAEPICIPFPSFDPIDLTLPSGGKIKGVADFTSKIPTDCTVAFSLLLQLGPILASLDCFIKLLNLIKPLIEVINNITNPAKLPGAVLEFGKAVEPVLGCVTAFTTPKGIACFIIDILRLIAKLLRCIVDQLKTIISVLGGLALQITSAQASGNTALLASLECSQSNAMKSAQGAMTAVEPIIAILSMVSPLLGIAGADPIEIPPLVDAESMEALEEIVTVLDEVTNTIELVADGLEPLC